MAARRFSSSAPSGSSRTGIKIRRHSLIYSADLKSSSCDTLARCLEAKASMALAMTG